MSTVDSHWIPRARTLAHPQDTSREPFRKEQERGQTLESLSTALIDTEAGPRVPDDAARQNYEELLQRARVAGTVIDTPSEIVALRDALRADLAAFESLALLVRDEVRRVQIQVRIDALWELLGATRKLPIRPTCTRSLTTGPQPAKPTTRGPFCER